MEWLINHFKGHLAVKVLFNEDHKTGPTMRKISLEYAGRRHSTLIRKRHKHQNGAWTSILTNINCSIYLECTLQENIQKEDLEYKNMRSYVTC